MRTPPPPMLRSLLRENENVRGTFSPQAYSIGLLEPLEKISQNLPAYPIEGTAEASLAFQSALVLYHEATHFAQYICTSFGLQMARITNICKGRILNNGPWNLPILSSSWEGRNGEDIDRFFAFKYLTESTFPTERRYPRLGSVTGETTLVAQPTSPILYLIPGEATLAEKYELIRVSNSQLHAEYHVLQTMDNGLLSDTTLNTAALMEGYAQLAELHHIGNAFRMEPEQLAEVCFSYLPIYTAAIATYLFVYELPPNFFVLHLSALIDIALMYSPHIIHNIGPCHSIQHGGQHYLMPAEIFINACAAAQRVSPLTSFEPAEAQRFQDAVCAAMGIPTTQAMNDLCLERLANIGFRTRQDCEEAFLDQNPINSGKQFALHWLGLNYRREQGAGFYTRLYATDQLIDILHIAKQHVEFFDLRTKNPYSFHPGRIYNSSQGALIWDALHLPRLECPLKSGRPYFCRNAGGNKNSLCRFFGRDVDARTSGLAIQQECLLDIFERLGGLASS